MPKNLSRHLVSSSSSPRRRWPSEEARAVLERLRASGLSVREFAAVENLAVQRLYRWRAHLGSTSSGNGEFVEIKPAAFRVIEVVLRSGEMLRVPRDFDEETLRRLGALARAVRRRRWGHGRGRGACCVDRASTLGQLDRRALLAHELLVDDVDDHGRCRPPVKDRPPFGPNELEGIEPFSLHLGRDDLKLYPRQVCRRRLAFGFSPRVLRDQLDRSLTRLD